MALVAVGAQAAKKKAPAKNENKPVFTVVKENPITTIKDQNRSGTCWDYSTLSFFEAEILKATGKTYDLCESFVANKRERLYLRDERAAPAEGTPCDRRGLDPAAHATVPHGVPSFRSAGNLPMAAAVKNNKSRTARTRQDKGRATAPHNNIYNCRSKIVRIIFHFFASESERAKPLAAAMSSSPHTP